MAGRSQLHGSGKERDSDSGSVDGSAGWSGFGGRSLLLVMGWFVRGVAMGLADTVPGISGGTMALITGIYPYLIAQVHAFFRCVVRVGWCWRRGEYRQVDWLFLVAVGGGVLTGAIAMALFFGVVVERYYREVWLVLCGLILASAGLIVRRAGMNRWYHFVSVLLGGLVGFVWMRYFYFPMAATIPGLFAGGGLAASAMVLPGISGSALLVALGLYDSVLGLVRRVVTLTSPELWWDGLRLLVFLGGVATGIGVMTTVLNWLFTRFYRGIVLFLAGLLVGVLPAVMPWCPEASDIASSGDFSCGWTLDLVVSNLVWIGVGMALAGGIHWFAQRWQGTSSFKQPL